MSENIVATIQDRLKKQSRSRRIELNRLHEDFAMGPAPGLGGSE